MLSKQNRLERSEYDLVFKKGRRIRGKNFSLIILPSENKNEPSQIGIIVTKKVFKKAVDRNKLKRQIRNTVNRFILKTLTSGQKIVVMAFPAPKPEKYQEIKEDLIILFSKI
jgi:ribonuclease P protein component